MPRGGRVGDELHPTRPSWSMELQLKAVQTIGGMLLALGLLLGFRVWSAAAQEPTPTPNMDDPARAASFGGLAASLAPHSAEWFQFDYAGAGIRPRQVVSLTLVSGNGGGIDVEIWSPDRMQGGWWNNKPIGRTTFQTVDCETGQISESGQCQSSDLVWQGAFGGNGIYYIRVYNHNDLPVTPHMILRGPGLAPCQGAAEGQIIGLDPDQVPDQVVNEIRC